jgi:hypothetical protein
MSASTLRIEVLREHARGEHTVRRIDCRACQKFPPGWSERPKPVTPAAGACDPTGGRDA